VTAIKARALVAILFLSLACIASAQVAVPALTGRVVDQAATLTSEQKATLEQTLQAFEAKKGSQIAVLIVPTTAPETIEQYGLRVAEQWKVGRKKIDDGAVLVVAKNDRAVRIEVGYGLEGVLTDVTSKRIISETIVPRFKEGDFYGGIAGGVDQIIRVIGGEPLPTPDARSARGAAGLQQYVPIIFILVLVVGGLLRSVLGRFPGALVTGGVVAVVAWFFAGAVAIAAGAGVLALLFVLLSGGMGGHGVGGLRGGLWMGGLGGGGMGGGGFGGGGGGFGGGGASGRW